MGAALRVGLIGLGGMGLYHAKNLHSKIGAAAVSCFFEPDEMNAAKTLKECEKPKRFSDPLELIRSDEAEAVIIASPDSTHAQFVLECLENRKPVFCEKPLASDPNGALSIVNREAGIGRKYISVGFQRRFDPCHLAVEKAGYSGEIGAPVLWKGVHRNPEAMYGTNGTFLLVNSAGHDVDSARWLLRSDVETIKVLGRKSRKELSEDSADLLLVTMEMKNGTLAQSELFLNAGYAYEVMVELVCQSGTAATGHTDRAMIRSCGNRRFPMSGDFRAYFDEAYLSELTEWVDSVAEGKSFRGADCWDGYSAVAVTFAGAESLKRGETIQVKTIERPALYR